MPLNSNNPFSLLINFCIKWIFVDHFVEWCIYLHRVGSLFDVKSHLREKETFLVTLSWYFSFPLITLRKINFYSADNKQCSTKLNPMLWIKLFRVFWVWHRIESVGEVPVLEHWGVAPLSSLLPGLHWLEYILVSRKIDHFLIILINILNYIITLALKTLVL